MTRGRWLRRRGQHLQPPTSNHSALIHTHPQARLLKRALAEEKRKRQLEKEIRRQRDEELQNFPGGGGVGGEEGRRGEAGRSLPQFHCPG